MNLKIFRFEKGKDEKPRYDIFPIRETSGMTVLDALFQIQDELDGSLSFRYSCRGAVCGSWHVAHKLKILKKREY